MSRLEWREDVVGQAWSSPLFPNGVRAVIELMGARFAAFLTFRGVLSPLDGERDHETLAEAQHAAESALQSLCGVVLTEIGVAPSWTLTDDGKWTAPVEPLQRCRLEVEPLGDGYHASFRGREEIFFQLGGEYESAEAAKSTAARLFRHLIVAVLLDADHAPLNLGESHA